MPSKFLKKIFEKLRPKSSPEENRKSQKQIPIQPDINWIEQYIKNAFGDSADLSLRRLRLSSGHEVIVAFIDGLVDTQRLSKDIISRIGLASDTNQISADALMDRFNDQLITIGDVSEIVDMADVLRNITQGNCAILLGGCSRSLICNIQGWEQRALEEPTTESSIRGSKEGFSETLRTNTSILRRRVRDPRLWIEEYSIGEISSTGVAVAYIKSIARDEVVDEVRTRLFRIETDSIHESGQLEEYIEDAPFSVFPTLLRTERPDRVSAALHEGRVAIITDGTPFVLVAPITFFTFLRASEDYFERFWAGSIIRAFRKLTFLISLILPSIYVAVTTFHQEMLPTPLLLRLAAEREGIPFPGVIEALMMETFFEILREAGIRLPPLVGPAIGIVGILIIGQSAVEAGLVTSGMIIIVGLTGIASFATPGFSFAITVRLLRFPIVIVSGILGLYGLFLCILVLIIHLVSLRSLGLPYMEPFSPLVLNDLKDSLIRAPWWIMDTRPELIAQKGEKYKGHTPRPQPPSEKQRRRQRNE